jgi:hypothetical protein
MIDDMAKTLEGRARVAKSILTVLQNQDTFLEAKAHRGRRWNPNNIIKFEEVAALLRKESSPLELTEGPIQTYMEALDKIRAKAIAPKNMRKAVCQRHSQAYEMWRGKCAYCLPYE